MKKSVAGKIVLIIILLLFAALIAGTVYIINSIKRPERPELIMRSPEAEDFIPTSTGTAAHLSFSDDAVMSMIFDDGDILYYLDKALGSSWYAELTEKLQPLGLELTGIGITAEPEGLYLQAGLRRGSTDLYLNADCEVTFADDTITMSPKEIRIGAIRLSAEKFAEKFNISREKMTWTSHIEHFFIAEIDGMELTDGHVRFYGKMATDYLQNDTVTDYRAKTMRFGQKASCYAGTVLDTCLNSGSEDCFKPILDRLRDNPEFFAAFLSQLFRVISPGDVDFHEMNYDMISRWFPELKDNYSADRTEETASFEMHMRVHGSLSSYVVKKYKSGNMKIKDGEFLFNNTKIDPEEFYGDNYVTYHNLFDDIDNARFCLCLTNGKGYTNMPRLSAIADSTDSISGDADKSMRYGIGLVLRGADGYGYVVNLADGFEIIPLEENTFLELMNASKVPLYITP